MASLSVLLAAGVSGVAAGGRREGGEWSCEEDKTEVWLFLLPSRCEGLFVAVQGRDAAVQERDAAVQERDAAIQERNVAAKERDAAVQERDATLNRAQKACDTANKCLTAMSSYKQGLERMQGELDSALVHYLQFGDTIAHVSELDDTVATLSELDNPIAGLENKGY